MLSRPRTGVGAALRGVVAGAMCAASLAVAGCADGVVTLDAAQQTARVPAATSDVARATWVVEAEPSTLDPIYDYGYYDNTIIANMCEPLVRMNADLTSSDWLASSRMVNPTTWTYDLRPGIAFWDGSPLTPADVVYSLGRNLDSEAGSYFGAYYSRVKSVTQTGPAQVTVRLKKPDALWNTSTLMTAGSYIVSKKFAEKAGERFGSPGTGVMCTGPYRFGRWTPGASMELIRNAQYWNHSVNVRTARLKFLFLTDSSAQANALSSGQAQGMYIRDQTIIPQLTRGGGRVYLGPGLTYFFVAPTLKKGPMADTRIRKALSMAIDRDAIAKAIFADAASPLYALVGADGWGTNPRARAIYEAAYDALPRDRVDVAAATKLFEQAGSPRSRIVLAYPTEGGSYQLKLASVIQEEGRRIGMNIQLKPLSPAIAAELYEDPVAMAKAGIDMISLSFNLNNADPFGMYQMFDPAAQVVDNYSRFYEPAATRLLERANGTYDDVARAKLTVAAQRIIMRHLPFVPVVSANAVVYTGKGVTGAPASFSQIWSAWAADLGGTSTSGQETSR